MRVFEFLSEASIFSRPTAYTYGHKVRVSTTSKNGDKLIGLIRNKISDFSPAEDLEWVRSPDQDSPVTKIMLSDSGEFKYFKRPNDDIIAIHGPVSTIESCLNHAPGEKGSTAENKGDLSEPILSAAVVAKLIKRGGATIADIDEEDVKQVLSKTLSSEGFSFEVHDKDSLISDVIKFTMAIRGPARDFMNSDGFWDAIGGLLPAVVHYSNSGQIDRYADYFYKNGKADRIEVSSDGMSEQKSRKTDIEAYATDENGNIKKLRNLKLSLKAGSNTIGGVGGGDIRNPFKVSKGGQGVWTNANNLFGSIGVDIPKPEGPVKNRSEFWLNTYEAANAQISRMLIDPSARSEAGIITKIANMINYHGTLDDPAVKLISLDPKTGTSITASFNGLVDKLKHQNINLASKLVVGRSKVKKEPRPRIVIYDSYSNKELITIRFSSTENGVKSSNSIEIGPLLKDLTKITKKKSDRKAVEPPPDVNPELDRLQKLAGVNQPDQTSTPGIRNQNKVFNKEPMGQTTPEV